jgi:hypothetical protein
MFMLENDLLYDEDGQEEEEKEQAENITTDAIRILRVVFPEVDSETEKINLSSFSRDEIFNVAPIAEDAFYGMSLCICVTFWCFVAVVVDYPCLIYSFIVSILNITTNLHVCIKY